MCGRVKGLIGHHQRVGGIAAEFEAGEPARLVRGQLQRLDLAGHRDRHADQAGLHRHFAQLVEWRQALGQKQALRVAVVAAAPVRHGGDRQHLDDDAVFALQPGLQRTEQIVAGIEHRGERLGLLLERRKMVRPALENLVHLVDRQAGAGKRGGPALARQKFVEIGKPLGLFAIGAKQLDHRGGSVGRRLGKLDQFLVTRQFADQQRIGKHFLQGGDRPPRLALQFVRVDLVDGCQLQDQLDRQRPLVALDEIEIGRRDAEPFGHRRLGQALGVADAADARPGEDLLVGQSICP